MKHCFTGPGIVTLFAFSAHYASAQTADASGIVTESTTTSTQLRISRTAAEYRTLRRVLDQSMRASRLGPVGDLSPDSLGDFTVTFTTHGSGRPGTAQAWPAAPWGGMSCTPGDTATISTCSGGLSQTWQLSCMAGGNGNGSWVTTGYSGRHVTSCQRQD